MMIQTPSARTSVRLDIGGSGFNDSRRFHTMGQLGESWQGVEDIIMQSPASNPSGSYVDYAALEEATVRFVTTKVTYQLNAANKFVGFAQPNWRYGERGGSALALWETRTYRSPGSDGAWKGEYQTARSDTLVMSVLFGNFYVRSGDSDFGQTTRPGARDRTSLRSWGASDSTRSRNNQDRYQARGNASWFKSDGPAGKHEVKGGFDLHWARAERSQLPRGQIGNYLLEFQRGVADRIVLLNAPVYPKTPMQFTHLYLQDSWTVGRRLTLNLGARVAHETAVIPEQCREAAEAPSHITFPAECYARQEMPAFTSLAPRLHGAYDVSGNARTVLKGGWARYYHMRSSDDLQIANLNTISQARCRWRDVNGNRDYDPGEVNFDPNGPDFIDRTLREIGSAFGGGLINPDTTQRYQDEVLLSIEQQLMRDWALRVTGVYAEAKNQWRLANSLRPAAVHNIAITNRDLGPDGVPERGRHVRIHLPQ